MKTICYLSASEIQTGSFYYKAHTLTISFLSSKRQSQTQVCKYTCKPTSRASQVVLVVKDLPASAGDIRDVGSIPG